MSPQQREAHCRMMGVLPVRTHVGVLRQDQDEPAVNREIKPIEIRGVVYKSQSKAATALGLSKYEITMMIKSGLARLIREPVDEPKA